MDTRVREYDKDLADVITLVASKDRNSEALRKARERADRIGEEMQEKYGVRNVAVDLVNEVRDSQ